MGAKCVEELVVWQLADELRRDIIRLTTTGEASRDRRFCSHIRETATSVCSNIAEGFDRFQPGEFAYFARVARGSVGEARDRLRDGLERAYWKSDDGRERLWFVPTHGDRPHQIDQLPAHLPNRASGSAETEDSFTPLNRRPRRHLGR